MSRNVLAAAATDVRFPSRCVGCGDPPEFSIPLRVSKLRIDAPACDFCANRSAFRRFLWWTFNALVGVGILIGLSLALETLPDARRWAGAAAFGLIALWIAHVIWIYRLGVNTVDRLWGPLWISRRDPLEIGFRDSRFCDEATELTKSGASTPAYAASKKTSPVFVPSFVVFLLGAGGIAAAFARYSELGRSDVVHMKWPEVIAYKIGGRTGVLVLFLLVAGPVLVLGLLMMWRMLKPRIRNR